MKIKETGYLTASVIRSICIENDWYTRGTNEDYSVLLSMPYMKDGFTQKNITTKNLYEMACDIFIHSDMTVYNDLSVNEALEGIMHVLSRGVRRYYEIID